MKTFGWMAGALALAVIGTGCAPELDQTQLSPDEQLWAKTFKENYSGWQAPESLPRGVRRDDIPEAVAAPGAEAPATAAPATDAAAPAADAAPVPAPVNGDVADAPAPVAGEAEAAAPAATADETYVVVKGDSLGKIAQKFYGKASAWKKIQDANADVLKGKTVIREGMKLKIPRP